MPCTARIVGRVAAARMFIITLATHPVTGAGVSQDAGEVAPKRVKVLIGMSVISTQARFDAATT